MAETLTLDHHDLLSNGHDDTDDRGDLILHGKDEQENLVSTLKFEKEPLSVQSSIVIDSDQELMEDYLHQIDCLKEEMLTEFPVVLPGLITFNDTCKTSVTEPKSSPERFVQYNGQGNPPNNKDVDRLVADLIRSVILSAENIVNANSLDKDEYSLLIVHLSKDLVSLIIHESIEAIVGNTFNPQDDLSPVLEPESPVTEDGDYLASSLLANGTVPTMEVFVQGDDSTNGMIIQGDCDLAPLSPIMECIESERSPEPYSYRRSDSDNMESMTHNQFTEFDDSKSSSLREFEDIEGDMVGRQSPLFSIHKSPSTDFMDPRRETTIFDDLMDISDTQSFTSNVSSQQCSVILTSRRAESLQQIDSDSAAGLAIDLLSSQSRTTSMSSSIMQTSCNSTDSVTLTATTTASTLVRVTQPSDDLISLSDNMSPGCVSSG